MECQGRHVRRAGCSFSEHRFYSQRTWGLVPVLLIIGWWQSRTRCLISCTFENVDISRNMPLRSVLLFAEHSMCFVKCQLLILFNVSPAFFSGLFFWGRSGKGQQETGSVRPRNTGSTVFIPNREVWLREKNCLPMTLRIMTWLWWSNNSWLQDLHIQYYSLIK